MIKNRRETSEMEYHIFLFEPGTSRIDGRKKRIYAHMAGRYNRVLMIDFAHTAAMLSSSWNQTLLIMAALQKIIQKMFE